ncbi:MAG: TolC family protein [Ignavibacteriaceae bacterium]
MRFFLSIFCVLFLTIASYAQKALTLDEAVNIALHKNTILEKAENTIKSYESGKLAAIGGFLPGLGARGNFRWERSEQAGGERLIEGIPTRYPSSISEERGYSAGIGYDWVLFDGLANFANLSRSSNDLESAKFNLIRLKQDIVFQTISLYYDIVNARQLLKVKDEDVKRFQKNLETATERNRLGAVTLADVYAQQVQVGNAELEVIRTQNLFETAKTNLLYYLGLDVLEQYSFADTLTAEEQNLLDDRISQDYTNLAELARVALESRPDYKGKQLDVESAEDGVTAAWSGHLPSLTNSGEYSTFATDIDNLFDSKSYSINLSLNIPIFSGFAVDNRVQQAKVMAENTAVELVELEREIKRSIQTTFLDLQAAEKALQVSERNVIAAEENRKIEEEKYNLGSGTILNVLIANSEYTNAVTNYINSQFAYIVLSEQLKYHIGNLDYTRYE